MSALLAPFFQARCPTVIGCNRLALLGIPEQSPALAVAKDTHVDRSESRCAQLRRTESFPVLVTRALEEVLPQRFGVVAFETACEEIAFHVFQPLGHARTAL